MSCWWKAKLCNAQQKEFFFQALLLCPESPQQACDGEDVQRGPAGAADRIWLNSPPREMQKLTNLDQLEQLTLRNPITFQTNAFKNEQLFSFMHLNSSLVFNCCLSESICFIDQGADHSSPLCSTASSQPEQSRGWRASLCAFPSCGPCRLRDAARRQLPSTSMLLGISKD